MFFQNDRTNHAKPWHADDIDQMAQLFFAGRSVPEVAKALGRTQEAVRTKANTLDFLPKRTRRKSIAKIARVAG